MALLSIEFLNARKDSMAAGSGGKSPGIAKRNPVDEKARLRALSPEETMEERLAVFWQEIRSFSRELKNLRESGLTPEEAAIPF